MKLYLSAEASLALIRYLRSTNGEDGLGGLPIRKKSLYDAINTCHSLLELDATAQRWLAHVDKPIQAFVSDHSKGTSNKQLITYTFAKPIPGGTLLDIGHDICICTPQFTFMRMAMQVDLVDAIRIGMELCGTYSQWSFEPAQMGDPYFRQHLEERSSTFNLPPAMSSKRTRAFVERLAGHRGVTKARTALRWVLDNSASPMETAVYLLLCLPKRLGGYGLPQPVLNPKLIIKNPDGTKERYPDLFWPKVNIDVEYNSDSDHSGEWSRYRDSKREVELVVANVKVLPLTRHQLMSATEFDAFAQGLRRMLGIRSRTPDLEWVYRRDELRRKLLSGWQR